MMKVPSKDAVYLVSVTSQEPPASFIDEQIAAKFVDGGDLVVQALESISNFIGQF